MICDVPSDLSSGPIQLLFDKHIDVEPGGELVPYYHFKIKSVEGAVVGHINLKVGNTRHIRMCVGHIGFGVLKKFRGNSYAYHACNALKPFVASIFEKVILTADPENISSLRTIEKLGAEFLEEIFVPADDPSYSIEANKKKRYEWIP